MLISWITWSPCSDTTTLDDYIDTPDETVVEGEVQEGRRYTEAEFNRIIEIERRERQRVEILLSQIDAAQLAEMQAIISAEQSDLFDVLAHVAYALPPIPRKTRAQQARLTIHSRFSSKQQLFLNFVLQHYVSSGVQELAQEKLAPGCACATATPSPMPWPTWASPRKSAGCSPASSALSMHRLSHSEGLGPSARAPARWKP